MAEFAPPGEPQESDHEFHAGLTSIASHLASYGAEIVVIGGWSIYKYFPELRYRTNDIDFIIATTEDNYERIAEALNSLGVREGRGGIPMKDAATFTAAKLRSKPHWRLYAKGGIFDLMVDGGGIEGYDHIVKSARRLPLDDGRGTSVLVADPEIVLASKKVANRDKDQLIIGPLEDAIAAKKQERERREHISSLAPQSPGDPSSGATTASRPRCKKWMPFAKAYCGRPKGHRGGHRRK